MSAIRHYEVASWADFKSSVLEEVFASAFGGPRARGGLIFRGQPDDEWELEASFDRAYAEEPRGARASLAQRLLATFLEGCQGVEGFEPGADPEERVLAFAQHHGLPTRLLDWSDSPYVAAFFAFCERLQRREYEGNVCVWIFDAEWLATAGEADVRVLRIPAVRNPRMWRQSGCFTLLSGSASTVEEAIVRLEPVRTVLAKIVIPAREAKRAIGDLDLMGINHANLFPGAGGAAQSATMRMALERA